MDKNKSVMLLVGLLIAMSMMSFAYAHWWEYLKIYGEVNTGEVNVEWSIEGCGDTEPDGKDCSRVEAVLTDFDQDGKVDLVVTVIDGYPCITYWVHFNVHCTGTVPVHFEPFVINSDPLVDVWIESDVPICEVQLHPCDSWYGYLKIHRYR